MTFRFVKSECIVTDVAPYWVDCSGQIDGNCVTINARVGYDNDSVPDGAKVPAFLFHVLFEKDEKPKQITVIYKCLAEPGKVMENNNFVWMSGRNAESSADVELENLRPSMKNEGNNGFFKVFSIQFDIAEKKVQEDEEKKEDSKNKECAVCFKIDELIQHTGCSHAVMCNGCWAACFRQNNLRCPICRAWVGALINIPKLQPTTN